jgi:glycosyltransferase involved in cell wall biosynthesis
MRIAQVAPLYESVPPRLYGGTERVVSYLTEELVRQGHEVTLFASGDSVTSARLVAGTERSLRLDSEMKLPEAHHTRMIELAFGMASEFDVIHFHIDCIHLPLAERCGIPHLTTLHGRLDLPDLVPLFETFPATPLVSISHAQRRPLAHLNWAGNVYHGLPTDLLKPTLTQGDYLAFVGRISPEKRVDRAIDIAIRSGIPLRIAAKVDKPDREYFEEQIEPLLAHPLVEYIGEIGDAEKESFIGNALALLFPIDWPEPFGLVMIEAFACGTPVVAWPCGSVPEIMRDGVSGYVVKTREQAVEAVKRIADLDRAAVRRYFDERFSAERMATDYVAIYERLCSEQQSRTPRRPRSAPRRRNSSNGQNGLATPVLHRLPDAAAVPGIIRDGGAAAASGTDPV